MNCGVFGYGGVVFVVDDVVCNVQLFGVIFMWEGYEVLIVMSGEGVLECFQVWLFDFVLFDFMMLGIDGMEVCCCIKVDLCMLYLLVIFFMVVSEVEIVVKVLMEGVVDFISKLFNMVELFVCVCMYVDLKCICDELKCIIIQKNEFMSVVVYDFKNLILFMWFSVYMLCDEGLKVLDLCVEFVDIILDFCDGFLKFIQDWFEWSVVEVKLGELQIESIDLGEVIMQVVWLNFVFVYVKQQWIICIGKFDVLLEVCVDFYVFG